MENKWPWIPGILPQVLFKHHIYAGTVSAFNIYFSFVAVTAGSTGKQSVFLHISCWKRSRYKTEVGLSCCCGKVGKKKVVLLVLNLCYLLPFA